MKDYLNPPEKILANLRGAPERMEKVDAVIGDKSTRSFSQAVAKILRHIEVKDDCLNGLVYQEFGAEVCLLLLSAASEFETGWNVLRLSNVPAAYRQTRVAAELIALAILVALPDKEIRSMSSKLQLLERLKNNPQKKIADLYKPTFKQQGKKIIKIESPIKGNMIYPAFLEIAEKILKFTPEILKNLDCFRKEVQHPASHGSMDVCVYHFEGFSGNRAGATFLEERESTYRKAAKDLTNLVHWHVEALDRTCKFLKYSNEISG